MGLTRTLNTLRTGERAVVHHLDCANGELRNRLQTMGLIAGTFLEVARIAPLGDPMKIKLLGFKLSLRMSEAEAIHVVAA